jgi:hypothetical protein
MTTLRRSPLDQVRCCGFCRSAIEMGIEGIDCRLAVGQVHCWLKARPLKLRCDRIANPLAEGRWEDFDWLRSNYCSNGSRKIAILLNGDVERLGRGSGNA